MPDAEPRSVPPIEVRHPLPLRAGGDLRRDGFVTRATLVATIFEKHGARINDLQTVAYEIEAAIVSMVPRKEPFVAAGSDAEERVERTVTITISREDAAILAAMR